jgi:hypothetical protein
MEISTAEQGYHQSLCSNAAMSWLYVQLTPLQITHLHPRQVHIKYGICQVQLLYVKQQAIFIKIIMLTALHSKI